jgi:hypothetical protein
MATAYPGGLRKRGGLLDYEDTIQATPRNAFFGGVADLLGQAYKLPEMPRLGVPGLDFVAANRNRLMDLLDIGSVQKTAEGMAYGNRLGTGRGMTYRPLPETVGAALTVAPMVAPAARMMGEGAMATGRFVAPKAGLLAENYMADMGFMPTMAERVGKLNASEVLFPGRTQASLSSAEKTALTKYKKSLDVPAVMRRERLALEGGGNIVEPTPGETFREGLGIEPTYLMDKYVVPVSSDWSGGGETIKQAAGVPLARPVKKQAGTKYGLLEQNIEEDVGWASMPGAASSKTNNLNEYADLGDTVAVSSLLGQDSSNFSHHIAQGLIGQLPVLRPSKDATILLNQSIQNKFVPKKLKDGTTIQTQPFKNFPGVTSENIYDIMAQGTKEYSAGDIRKAISEEMSKAKFRDLGFPKWDTFTNLVNEPGAYTGASGGVMFKAKPQGKILTPTYEHGSYTSGIPTEGVLGGFKNAAGEIVTVPDYKIFRKTFERLRNQGKTDANIRTSILKAHHGEQVDQQTMDGLLKYLGYIP